MRTTVVTGVLLGMVLSLAAVPATGQSVETPRVEIRDVGMVSQSLRITLATSGVNGRETDSPTLTVSAWPDGMPLRATVPLRRMPARFALDLDLGAGAVRLAGITVGEFAPLRRFAENMRFPVEVTLQRGPLAGTARAVVMIPLPTIIVPGYLSEVSGPEQDVLAAFAQHGFRDAGPAQTLFWFSYRSLHMSLEQGARDLDAYVREVVLPATFASKVNIVGYSLGGLVARWNVAYNPGWATLVNRLVLVGVPNEGTVMSYMFRGVPSFVPYGWWAHAPVVPELFPTFPFSRATSTDAWQIPPDGGNGPLAKLNARPIPASVRVYVFYGSSDPGQAARTMAGFSGGAVFYGPGDGIVLAASAQGLPIQGGSGVAAFADRPITRVNLGPVDHMSLLSAGADRISDALLDWVVEGVAGKP